MAHRLKTPEGRYLYALRKHTEETVFGISNRGSDARTGGFIVKIVNNT
jgi:hypothetical protein